MKPIIYFDYNVFIDYMRNTERRSEIESLKADYIYFYGPPYLEEVANIGIENKEDINEHIKMIDSLFNYRIFRPELNGDIVKYREPAQVVFNRVIEDPRISQIAELLDSELFVKLKNERERNNFQTKVISNFSSNKVFLERTVKDYIDHINQYRSVLCPEIYTDPLKNKEYLNNHRKTEAVVNALFNVLEAIGYRAEKSQGNTVRSRMHDVSHAIYATKSDVFVIEDKKFRGKCKAVYSILGVETKIVSYDEFVKL